MISYQQAIATIKAQSKQLDTEEVSTSNIVGRICAEDIKAPLSIQPFDNSAMDGFAFPFANISPQGATTLSVNAKIAAGEAASGCTTQAGECWEIMTGAPMPADCDTVIPIENITQNGDSITISSPITQGDHVRLAGQDFLQGDTVITAGVLLGAEHVLILATLGIPTIPVYQKVKVAVLSTGNEVVQNLAQSLGEGQIYNSTGPYLIAALAAMGADVVCYETMQDTPESFASIMQTFADKNADIIISTGAVSEGKHDFIPDALQAMGAEILYHKMFIRPGKPNLFAKTTNDALFFGLPGNPMATVAGLRFFVSVAMRHMQNREAEQTYTATLSNDVKVKKGFRFFVKTHVTADKNGKLIASILPKQASFMVSPLSQANGWSIIAEDVVTLAAGDTIEVAPLLPNSWDFDKPLQHVEDVKASACGCDAVPQKLQKCAS